MVFFDKTKEDIKLNNQAIKETKFYKDWLKKQQKKKN